MGAVPKIRMKRCPVKTLGESIWNTFYLLPLLMIG